MRSAPVGSMPTGRAPVFVHIGTPKSGTTYLQNALWSNREELRRQGLLYPGDDAGAHASAAFDLRETFFDGVPDPRTTGAWNRLVAEVERWNGPAVISQELLGQALPWHVERALQSLAFADVHLVLTVRDLGRQIAAAWQETVKNRSTTPYEEFIANLRAPASDWSPPVRAFWRGQNLDDILTRWGCGIAESRIHVVTVPPSGAEQNILLRRFCSVIGVDADRCDPSRVVFGNPSLGRAETEVVRRINVAIGADYAWSDYAPLVKRHLAQEVLNRRRDTPRITLPGHHASWVAAWSEGQIEALRRSGHHLVGDLADLRFTAPADGDATADAVDQGGTGESDGAAMLDPCVEVIEALLLRRACAQVPAESFADAGSLAYGLLAALRKTADRLIAEVTLPARPAFAGRLGRRSDRPATGSQRQVGIT